MLVGQLGSCISALRLYIGLGGGAGAQGDGEYKQFVANRINKINEHQGVVWRHVPSAFNLADLARRGGQVDNADLWWDGPQWLSNPEFCQKT